MTNQELNRDIKRLSADYKALGIKYNNSPDPAYYDTVEKKIKPEFKRLYGADDSMSAMNVQSIRIMIRLNILLRIVPFHSFGININL